MPIHRKPNAHTHEIPGARFTRLASPSRGSQMMAMWHLELDAGTPGTPHELTAEEVFFVLGGRARVHLASEVTEAHAGDCIVVPPNTSFTLEAVGPTSFSAICCFPVGGRARLGDGSEFTPPWAE